MKSLIQGIAIALGLLSQWPSAALCQFRFVPELSGVALAPSSAVTGDIRLAGGGVILRAVALPDESLEGFSLNACKLTPEGLLLVECNEGAVTHISASWILRDAAHLVAAEGEEVFRIVNLLGEPQGIELGLSPDDYFFVELSPELASTRTGEVLMVVDLILSDPLFYAGYSPTAARLQDRAPPTMQTLAKVAQFTRTTYRATRGLPSEAQVWNWTWTDAQQRFSFAIDRESKRLVLRGTPLFTFLDGERRELPALAEEFAGQDAIHALNPAIFGMAIEFARVSAFFRYVKTRAPQLWESLLVSATQIPPTSGRTPRLIAR